MADATGIDWQSLFSNPLFLGGTAALLAEPNDRYKALLGGMQQGTLMQQQAKMNSLRDLQIKAEEARQNFNPSEYMQTAPVQQGSALPSNLLAQFNNQMPAGLGGPIGGQTQMMPMGQTQVQPEPGNPTGRVDMQGLLQGGMQAGLNPAAIQQIAGIMDPETANRQALALKMGEPYTLSPGQSRMVGNQVIGENGNAPVTDPSAVLARTRTAAAQARAAGNTALADQLDALADKQSGAFDQRMQAQRQEELQNQRQFNNGMAQDRFQNQQEQQVQKQAATFSNQMQKIGIPQAQQQLDTIDAILAKHADSADKVPGYGRLEGAVPGMFLSGDAQELRQAVQSLANVVLKMRSGAAVTEPEQKRFIIELGSGAWMPEERLIQGLKMMRGLVNSEKANAAAGASNDVLDSYSATPGAIDMTGYKRAGGGGGGRVSIDQATPDDIAAAIARKKGQK